MDSDSSSYYQTTYSQDERIESALREERRIEKQLASNKEQARKELFENYAHSDLPLFELPGLKFHAFRHLKIKFSFEPAAISKFVRQNVKFYISLKYQGKYWRIKRDSLPANFKWTIYKLFYSQNFFMVDDENIFSIITKIYELLVAWTRKEQAFRVDKYQRYKKGEDVELDSDDEQLFLTQEERIELYQKRVKILKRMIPPKNTQVRSPSVL